MGLIIDRVWEDCGALLRWHSLRINHVLFGLVAWMALSWLWTADRLEGADQLSAIAVMAVLFLAASRWRFERLPLFASVAVGCVLAAQAIWPVTHGGFGNENFLSEFVLISMPFVVLAFWQWRSHWYGWLAALVVLGSLAYLFGFNGSNQKWAIVLGASALAAVHLAKRGNFVDSLIATLIPLNAVLLLTDSDMWSALAVRLEFVIDTAAMALAAPIAGHGVGSFNFVYPDFQEAHLTLFPFIDTRLHPVTMFAGAAHNEPMQIWAEYGLVGLALAGAFIWTIWSRYRAKERDGLDHAAAASLAITGVLSLVAFPLHNPATAFLAVIAAGAITNGASASTWCIPRRWTVVPASMIAGLLLYGATLDVWAQMHFSRTLVWIKVDPLRAFKENLAAVRLYPLDRGARHQLILTLGRLATVKKEDLQMAPAAADKVYEISTSAGMAPAVKLARLEYLINTRRNTDEIEELLADLKKTARLHSGVWLAEAYFAARIGDVPRALAAARTGTHLPGAPASHIEQFNRLMEAAS